MTGDSIDLIEKKEAKSGKVSYADPVVLYESSKTKVTLIPFFIERSQGVEVSIKLQTHVKGKPPFNWIFQEEKSLTLNFQSSKMLFSSLKKYLTLTGQTDNGEYILLKAAEGDYSFGNRKTEDVAQAIITVLNQPDILQHLVDKELKVELTNAFKNAIRLQELRSAVLMLRDNLENGVKDEQVYQEWCENHPWAFGNSFIVNDKVRSISASDKIDLMLPTVISGYRDLVELKRPDMEVLNYDSSHKNYYFNSEVSKVIGQCHRYLDVFLEEASRGLRDHPEIIAYHPKVTIVIGRSDGWEKEKHRALHGLNSRLNSINIITYDQLLAQGERMIEIVTGGINNLG